MPGLLRGVARTAVVAGTATAVSNRVSRRQANRWAGQEQAQADEQQQAYAQQQAYQQPAYAAPAPAAPAADDMDTKLAQLKELGQLKEQGVLTEEEFQAQKRRLLNS
jgi:Short C-terminal domain